MNTSPIAITEKSTVKGRSLWVDARTRLMANKAAVCSIIMLCFISLLAIFGPMITGHDYETQYKEYTQIPAGFQAHPSSDKIDSALKKIAKDLRVTLESQEIGANSVKVVLVSKRPVSERYLEYFPRSQIFGSAHIIEKSEDNLRATIEAPIDRKHFFFGTDVNGRDLLTRTLWACRISLLIGLATTLVAGLIGVTYGATSGYLGGRTDLLMMRLVDILYSLPFIFFVIMLMVFFGRNFLLMFIAIGAVEWLDMARIVRGQTLSIKRQEYVQAAEALGVSNLGIIRRHIIPNTLGPVIVYMTLLVPKVVLLESFLSFFGLGVQEPWTSLGVLISNGAKTIQHAPWMLVFPSIFLVTLLFCLNFIGDGLRDALDPKDR